MKWPTYDPNDPFDAVCDSFRRDITEIALRVALQNEQFKALSPRDQVRSFIVGCLTAMIGSTFARTPPEHHDSAMSYIRKALPLAREFVDTMTADGR